MNSKAQEFNSLQDDPHGVGADATALSARRQQAEQFEAGVTGASDDHVDLQNAMLGVEVFNR